MAINASFKVRTSPSLVVDRYWGNFFGAETADQVNVAGMDSDKSVMVSLSLKDDKLLSHGPYAYAQSAFLYTHPTGERRIRVHTQQFQISESIQEMFRRVDFDTVLTHLVRTGMLSLDIQLFLLFTSHFKMSYHCLLSFVQEFPMCFRMVFRKCILHSLTVLLRCSLHIACIVRPTHHLVS